jgi:hypothetical protein
MSSITCCCKKLSLVLALLALVIVAAPAFAQGNCLQDEYTASGGGSVVCTANDVQLAAVKNVQVIGGVGNKCIAGSTFSFLADFEVVTTSKSSRSNIGLYFGTGTGTTQNGALSGTCTDSIIAPPHTATGAACTIGSAGCFGSDHYEELDGNPSVDNCGDTSSTDTSPTYPGVSGAQGVVIQINNVTCPTSGTSLSLPECTSWQVPGKQLTCFSPSPSFPYNTNAVPGSPSKCSCGVLSVPVQPVQPAATVAKSCTTTLSSGLNTSCDAGPEGSRVTYTVTITNTTPTGEGGLIVDQICDNQYGNIFTASGFAACPAGTLSIVAGSASSCATLGTISNGGNASCTFQADEGELASVTDHVTVQGHSDVSASAKFGPDQSNNVTVTSSDAPSSATITKGLVSTTAACATVRYSVDVHNSSGADEVETLSAFNDSAYGSITTVHDSVLGTTCGVATGVAGLGTLSGSTGGGSLPATVAVGGDYTCRFDASFCGNTGPVEEFGTGACDTVTTHTCTAGNVGGACTTNAGCDITCPLGISHVNAVSGTIHGDEGATDAVTQTDHTLTVNECLASFTSSQ